VAVQPPSDRRLAFRTAVEQSEETLRQAVRNGLHDGVSGDDLLADLQAIRAGLSEEVEDRVLYVMDELVGWCGPHARLQP
jgi:hypothetical protein